MAICTYLTDQEFEAFKTVSDSELNELLQEVRETQPRIFVSEYTIQKWNGLFKKRKPVTLYNVYNELSRPEVQLINFVGLGNAVDKIVVMAYFFGLLTRPK